MKNKVLSILFFSLLFTLNAQVRRDIFTYSDAEQDSLAQAMIDYIDVNIIKQHCSYTELAGETNLDIHSDFDFLPFHRLYLEGLEDYLYTLGPYYHRFVPLPSWNPEDCAPVVFQNIGNNGVDPDCLGADYCADILNDKKNCAPPVRWCPKEGGQGILPNFLKLAVNAGPYNDLCDWPLDPIAPNPNNHCCEAGLSRVILGGETSVLSIEERGYHNGVHLSLGGVMYSFRSPALPAFWIWHAYVDDIWRTWEEYCPQSGAKAVDLYMKDTPKVLPSIRDRGVEPNIDTTAMWLSNDIWVRNQADGFQNAISENPIANGIDPVYVYVRVRNRGYEASLGTEKIRLHWSKAATSLAWPQYWNGQGLPDAPGLLAGDIIGEQTVSSIVAGGQTILQFTWYPPDPSDYESVNKDQWHFCLLARIEAANDPMTYPETEDLNSNVKNNNNIVWKNVTIVDASNITYTPPNCPTDVFVSAGTVVAVANPYNVATLFNLHFSVPQEELAHTLTGNYTVTTYGGVTDTLDASAIPAYNPGVNITEEATIILSLDSVLYSKWKLAGGKALGVEEINEHSSLLGQFLGSTLLHDLLFKAHRKLFRVTATNVVFQNILLAPEEYRTTSMLLLYPNQPVSTKQKFTYDIQLKKVLNNQLVGGVQYAIRKPNCSGLQAFAGNDRRVRLGCSTFLQANDVACATYRWTDESGKVVARTRGFEASPLVKTTYTLTVISPLGCVASDDVVVTVNPFPCLQVPNPFCVHNVVIYPNPTQGDELQLSFVVDAPTQVLISFRSSLSAIPVNTYEYNAQTGLNDFNIDITNLFNGSYVITLQCVGSDAPVYTELFQKF